jgi:hypothetical protein
LTLASRSEDGIKTVKHRGMARSRVAAEIKLSLVLGHM